MGISSVFVTSTNNSPTTLEATARGDFRVVFLCPEELECPTFSPVVHCKNFQNRLSAVYVDESHLVRGSKSWRDAYTHLYMFRRIIGFDIPLVCMSATLPATYRQDLELYAGLQPGYRFFNLGNFRPELATVVFPMRYDASTFHDLAFLLPMH